MPNSNMYIIQQLGSDDKETTTNYRKINNNKSTGKYNDR